MKKQSDYIDDAANWKMKGKGQRTDSLGQKHFQQTQGNILMQKVSISEQGAYMGFQYSFSLTSLVWGGKIPRPGIEAKHLTVSACDIKLGQV